MNEVYIYADITAAVILVFILPALGIFVARMTGIAGVVLKDSFKEYFKALLALAKGNKVINVAKVK